MTKTFLTTIFLRSSQFVNDIKYEFLTRMHIPNFKNVLRRKLRGGPPGYRSECNTRKDNRTGAGGGGGGGGSGTKCRTSRWWVGHFFSQKHS